MRNHPHPTLSWSTWACAALLACASTGALAETDRSRYDADLKLCSDESSPEARLQCRRDARFVYDKTLKIPANQAPTPKPAVAAPAVSTVAATCTECARVTSISMIDKPGEANTAGMLAGGLAGAVLGRQVGGGFGKDLSTLAGAAGGAYAGKKIQENMNKGKSWQVAVTYTDGRTGQFEFGQDPGFSVGDAVKQVGNSLVRN